MTALDRSLRRPLALAGGRITGLFLAWAALVAVAVLVRVPFMPLPGFAGDLDQFVLWVHGLATQPFGRAYDQNLSFLPVMVYVWGALAALEPAFRAVTTAADEAIRFVMKTPAVIADLALASLVVFHLRRTPSWALLGGVLVAFHPAVIDVSAWWGQYESVYVVFGVLAFVLVVRGHSLWGAAALALSLMTKPQAVALAVPFAAWFVAREGWAGSVRAAVVGGLVIVAVWLPFIPATGPQHYAQNLAAYQGDVFAILSLRAWNMWWLVQELLAGGSFVSDQGAILGPITLRHVGYGLALLGELTVFAMVYRARTPRALALGLAAAALVAFCLLTTMHERYAFGALAFLPLALPDRRVLALTVAFGAVFTLNLLAAVPPTPGIGAALPVGGVLGVVGSVAMLGILGAVMELLRRELRAVPDPALEAAIAADPSGAMERAA